LSFELNKINNIDIDTNNKTNVYNIGVSTNNNTNNSLDDNDIDEFWRRWKQ